MKAEIKVKQYRKIVKRFIPVQDLVEGQTDSLPLFEINGVALVPVSESAKYVGVNTSMIRRWIDEGRLSVYNANGTLKRGNKSTKTFFDLNEFLSIE